MEELQTDIRMKEMDKSKLECKNLQEREKEIIDLTLAEQTHS